MNSVRFDYADPDIKAAMADCKVGEPKTLTITLTPTEIGDGFIAGDLDSIKYKKPKKAMEYEDDEEGDDEMPPAVKRVKIKAKSDDEEM